MIQSASQRAVACTPHRVRERTDVTMLLLAACSQGSHSCYSHHISPPPGDGTGRMPSEGLDKAPVSQGDVVGAVQPDAVLLVWEGFRDDTCQ